MPTSFHCEPIEKTADDFITLRQIPQGSFDNVAACRYTVPDYWTIGEVYERLIEDTAQEDTDAAIVDKLMEVYTSWIDTAISNYNSDFYYQSRDYIADLLSGGRNLRLRLWKNPLWAVACRGFVFTVFRLKT